MSHDEVSIGIPAEVDATETAETRDPTAVLVALATNPSIFPESVGALPLPFTQPDVEFAFQAQHTRNRIFGVFVAFGLLGAFDVATAAFGIAASDVYGTHRVVPPVFFFATGGIYLLISALARSNRATWQHQHQKIWRFYACALCWFWIRMYAYAILYQCPASCLQLVESLLFFRKYHCTSYTSYLEGSNTSYLAGILTCGSVLGMVTMASAFWLFALPVIFAISFCTSPALSNVWTQIYSVIALISLGVWVFHSLKEQRIAFCERVTLHRTHDAITKSRAEVNLISASLEATERGQKEADAKIESYAGIARATTHDLRTLFAAFSTGCKILTSKHATLTTTGTQDSKQLLLKQDDEEECTQQKEVLKHMTSAVRVGLSILDGISVSAALLKGEKTAIEMQNCSVSDLLTNAMACAQLSRASNAVQYDVTIEQDLDTMYTDSGAVSRNLLNLLTNAIRHTSTGKITASAKLVTSDKGQDVEEKSESNKECFIEFAVSDTGCGGVAANSKIWEPFVSMADSTGLGLWVVKKQVEALGGTVGVSENLTATSGSVFWFRLPYLSAQAQHATRVPARISIPLEAPRCSEEFGGILIIDDVRLHLELQAKELRINGFTVETAMGHSEGLRLMKQCRWKLVLCDYNMPGQTGAELTATLREFEIVTQRPRQLIVGLTSNKKSVQDACLEAGMQDVFSKPLDVRLVSQFIEMHPLMHPSVVK